MIMFYLYFFFFFSSRRRHTRWPRDWSSDVCSSDLATDATRQIIGPEVLAALPDHAVLINVGRGATVDQQALREALEAGTLGSAALDVTDPEPLPAGDPLWDAPRLLITPHAAGGRPVDADQRISENVRALSDGTGIAHVAAR